MSLPIPNKWEKKLLPSHSLSVLSFLKYDLPSISTEITNIPAKSFFCNDEPDVLEHERLRAILVPHHSILSALATSSEAAILAGSKSILCAHITYDVQARVPLWMISYWSSVIALHNNHRQAWLEALDRLNMFKIRWERLYGPQATILVSKAFAALSSLSWAGHIRGFSEQEPKYKLSTYMTCRWLSDTHENQMLDLLRAQFHLSNIPEPLIQSTDFIKAVRTAHRKYQETGNYAGRRAFQHLYKLGDQLHTGTHDQLATIMLVRGAHWTAAVIDFPKSVVFYGDSEGDSEPDKATKDALTWWTAFHSGRSFKFEPMIITHQLDKFSCGLLAWNALMHFFFPHAIPLIDAKKVDVERLNVFLQVIKSHSDQQHNQDIEFEQASLPDNTCDVTIVSDRKSLSDPPSPCYTLSSEEAPDSNLGSPLVPAPSPQPPSSPQSSSPQPPSSPPPPPSKHLKVSVPSAIHRAIELNKDEPEMRKKTGILGFFSTCTKEEYTLRIHRLVEEKSMKEVVEQDRNKRVEERRREEKREYDRERQEKHRSLKRELEIQKGERSPGGTKRKRVDVILQPDLEDDRDIAELSRPARQILREEKQKTKKNSGRKQKKEKAPAKYVNWHEPFLWSQILSAARHPTVGHRMSAFAIRNQLIVANPRDFAKISANTIEGWIDRSNPDHPRWSEKALKMAKNGSRPSSNGGRTGVLKPYPDVVDTLITLLVNLREAGTPLSLITIRGLTIATILARAPRVFERRAKNGSVFQCSDSWMRRWLHRTMHWSERRATRAAQKLPADWESQCEKSFLRLAHDIKEHDIPSALYVNTDQSQGVYAQGAGFTWAETGSKQVSTVGADEKRAMTIVVSVSNSGILLPFQAVYKGASALSCPKRNPENQENYQLAESAGFRFEYSGNDTYWSTQKTMKSLVNDIIAPYFDDQKEKLGLPARQKSLWQIDVWSVHRSDEFRSWMKVAHPNIIIHFVPGGCTGVFQPCDVGIQRMLKHSLKRSCHNDIVVEVLGQFQEGVEPAEVKFDRSVGILRDRTVSWLWNAYWTLNKPEIVKKAFKMCKTKGFDLSYESLTSFDARERLRSLKDADHPFWRELTSKRPLVIDETGGMVEDEAEKDDANDDSDISMDVIINHAVHGQIGCGVKSSTNPDDPGLKSTGEMENIFYDARDGSHTSSEVEESSSDEEMIPAESVVVKRAPGKRQVKPVKRYTGEEFWRH